MFSVRSFVGSSLRKSRCINAFQHSGSNFASLASKTDIFTKLNIPEKPKKPLTPFMKYFNDNRLELIKENPKVKITDLGKLASEKWKLLDPNIKKEIMTEYSSKLVDYMRTLKSYNSQLTDEQKLAIKQVNLEAKEERQQRRMKKDQRELGKPLKPPSPFYFYVKDLVNEQNQQMSREFLKLAAEKWACLSDEKKKFYKANHQELFKNYQNDLMKWEVKMIEKGRQDLIRKKSRLDTSKEAWKKSHSPEKQEHHGKSKVSSNEKEQAPVSREK